MGDDMKVISLNTQLIKSTIIISLILALLGFIAICLSVAYSNNHVFDELLESNAHALLGDNDKAYPDIEHSLQYLNDEMDIEYQVINKDGVMLSKTLYSPDAPYLRQFDNDAYYNIWHDGGLYRIYTSYDQGLNRYVQIAQPWSQRLEFAVPIVANYAGFMLLLLIALLIGNSLAIRKNLKPLNNLKQEISQKNLQNLSPITPPIVISETKPLLEAINQLFARLIRAKEAQERFTADASHELRTPLSAVQMKLQLLQRRYAQDDAVVAGLDEVRQDVGRATALVESLLALARLDSDAIKEDFCEIAVVDLLTEVVARMQMPAQNANAVLHPVFLERSLDGVTIKADERLLGSAVGNLIDNAIKYGGAGVAVWIDVTHTSQQLTITVSDNGVGVSDADLARLSERFFRVLGSQKTGSGLGLSIVAKIAEHHHGQLLLAKSTQHGGLSASIVLPKVK
ncbi:hypothetical protein B0680_01180 [Moraxella pluranimalium]|uniref:histidine kinase n=2 Tax=Moraxella pluranimalium TaxID=470453 RepID=A0A1T0CUJ7_9GAMM|nr:hypothetical protein B0680_01180 [Moraxella pluranimalium]